MTCIALLMQTESPLGTFPARVCLAGAVILPRRIVARLGHTVIHIYTGPIWTRSNLPTSMSLECGRKPEYPEETHAGTGRTCKLQADGVVVGIRTSNPFAARRKCYSLHHCAAQVVHPQKGAWGTAMLPLQLKRVVVEQQ